jgi:hypothetical protein
VEPVSGDRCDHWHGLLAMEVVGQLPDEDRLALSAHLDGCPACRDERDGLVAVASILPAADPHHFDGHDVPFELQSAVFERLHAEARRRRYQRLWRVGAAAVAAAAAAVALVLVLAGSPSLGPGHSVALTGRAGVTATARLTSEPWGTAIHLQETGQAGGQVLTVLMRTQSGSWWAAGTYRTVTGRAVQVQLGCGVPLSKIGSIWVRNKAGRTVLHAYVA